MRFAFFVEADPTVRGESGDALVVSIRGNRHFEEITVVARRGLHVHPLGSRNRHVGTHGPLGHVTQDARAGDGSELILVPGASALILRDVDLMLSRLGENAESRGPRDRVNGHLSMLTDLGNRHIVDAGVGVDEGVFNCLCIRLLFERIDA